MSGWCQLNTCLALISIWLVLIECVPIVDVAGVNQHMTHVNECVSGVDEYLAGVN